MKRRLALTIGSTTCRRPPRVRWTTGSAPCLLSSSPSSTVRRRTALTLAAREVEMILGMNPNQIVEVGVATATAGTGWYRQPTATTVRTEVTIGDTASAAAAATATSTAARDGDVVTKLRMIVMWSAVGDGTRAAAAVVATAIATPGIGAATVTTRRYRPWVTTLASLCRRPRRSSGSGRMSGAMTAFDSHGRRVAAAARRPSSTPPDPWK